MKYEIDKKKLEEGSNELAKIEYNKLEKKIEEIIYEQKQIISKEKDPQEIYREMWDAVRVIKKVGLHYEEVLGICAEYSDVGEYESNRLNLIKEKLSEITDYSFGQIKTPIKDEN